jgi:AcrR family transcriptional regulator
MSRSSTVVTLPRGTQARGRTTRANLLKVAQELFVRLGYERTTMGDIAGRAGVGVGTLYHHFPDKRALLLELIDAFGDRLAANRRGDEFAAFLGDDARAAIEAWLRARYARLRAGRSLYPAVVGLLGSDDELRRRFERVEQLAIDSFRGLIEFGTRRGLMRKGIDADAAAFLIHHTLEMAVGQVLLRAEPAIEPERVLEELVELICRYLIDDAR